MHLKNNSSFLSPQARARGLGTAKSGFHHWWRQRITALALVPLSLGLVYGLAKVSHGGYMQAQSWVRSPCNAIGLILFLVTSSYHSYLGMQVIFEDYIHWPLLRLISRTGLLFLLFAAATVGIFSVLRQAL